MSKFFNEQVDLEYKVVIKQVIFIDVKKSDIRFGFV